MKEDEPERISDKAPWFNNTLSHLEEVMRLSYKGQYRNVSRPSSSGSGLSSESKPEASVMHLFYSFIGDTIRALPPQSRRIPWDKANFRLDHKWLLLFCLLTP
jgi:hypothetical protein